MQGEKEGEDSPRKFNAGWKTGRQWLDFRKVTTTDHDSAGNSVMVTAMFCKWCEMAGFNHNDRGKPTVWTDAGGGCQRAKVESVKDHEVTQTHKEAANLQMNQSDMKEAVKTAILQDDHVLLNLTSIILSMAEKFCSECGAESAPAGQRLPAAGRDLAWAARTGSGPMWMCGDIFAAARRWRGRLLTTGRLSCRHPVVVCAGRGRGVAVAGRAVAWACSGRGAAICVRVSSSVNHL